MKIEYSYTQSQVRVFPPQQDVVLMVDDLITKLDVWASKKLKELDRSEKE